MTLYTGPQSFFIWLCGTREIWRKMATARKLQRETVGSNLKILWSWSVSYYLHSHHAGPSHYPLSQDLLTGVMKLPCASTVHSQTCSLRDSLRTQVKSDIHFHISDPFALHYFFFSPQYRSPVKIPDTLPINLLFGQEEALWGQRSLSAHCYYTPNMQDSTWNSR